jgi:hypothetical protein
MRLAQARERVQTELELKIPYLSRIEQAAGFIALMSQLPCHLPKAQSG